MKFCPDCGCELNGESVCPQCGYQVPDKESVVEESPQKVEVTSVNIKVKRSTKKTVVTAVAVTVAVAIFILLGINIYKVSQEKKAQSLAAEKALEYSSNLILASNTMILGASEAESAGNLIQDVWNNAIQETPDMKTDKYTRPDGWFVFDFNRALSNLFSDEDFQNTLSDIESNQEKVADLMKELRNPPDEYEDAYDAIKDCYNVYLNFTNLVVNPSGSLQTFSANFNDGVADFVTSYNSLKMYLD